MVPAIILKIVCFFAGVFMLSLTVSSLAKRKMNESFCLAWGIISVSIILAGFLLNPTELYHYISAAGLILILVIFFTVVYAGYFISVRISELSRQKQELAIELSLLKEENEKLIQLLQEKRQ